MSRQEKNALVSSVTAVALGLALSIWLQEGHWFARAGAVVAVVSIVFASLEIRKRLADASGFIDAELLKQRSKILKQCIDKKLDLQTSMALVEQVEVETRAEVNEEIRKASKRILRVELGLLLFGTLIWGFGDLPLDLAFGKFANKSMHATCEDARA